MATQTKRGSFYYTGTDNINGIGSNGNDSEISGNGNDTLKGNDGDDYLQGWYGNDFLDGGTGNDTLAGYHGNDTLYGYHGVDTLDGGAGDDYIAGGHDNDSLDGDYGDDSLFGGMGDDSLEGRNGDDILEGDNGNDYLYGGAGNDTLYGEYGNDTIFGGSGYDIATYTGSYTSFGAKFSDDGVVQITGGEGTDLLIDIERIYFSGGAFYDVHAGDQSNNSLTADPNVFSLLSSGAGNDTIVGGNYNDTLDGGNGNDYLSGGAGNDYLNGYGSTVTDESQFDWLSGGAGSDYFVLGETGKVFYNETGNGYAVISDFEVADRVQFSGLPSQYKIEFSSVSGIGNNAQDTEIFYNSNNNWERIGIIQDSTSFTFSGNAVFV